MRGDGAAAEPAEYDTMDEVKLLLLLLLTTQTTVNIQQARSACRAYTGPLTVWAVEHDGSRSPRSFSDLSVHCASFSPDEKEIVVVQLGMQDRGPIFVSCDSSILAKSEAQEFIPQQATVCKSFLFVTFPKRA